MLVRTAAARRGRSRKCEISLPRVVLTPSDACTGEAERLGAKLSRVALRARVPREGLFGVQQDVIQDVISLKTILVREEAVKAKRRAAHKGKAYGKLLWLLLRHAQRDPCTETALSLLTTRLGFYSLSHPGRVPDHRHGHPGRD